MEKEIKREDLKEGVVYTCLHKTGARVLSQYKENKKSRVRLVYDHNGDNTRFISKGFSFGKGFIYTIPTTDEVNWFNRCKKVMKILPFKTGPRIKLKL